MTQKSYKILVHKLDSGYLIENDGKKIACNKVDDAQNYIIEQIKASFRFHFNGIELTEIIYHQYENPPQKI